METKAWYQSKTIWGTLIAGACLVLQLVGVGEVSPEEQATMVNNITNIALLGGEIFGLVMAIIGRFKAKVPIGS